MVNPPQRIVLVKLGAIGDVLNVLPFVNRLRRGWPEVRLDWVIAPLAASLVRGHPAVDEFLVTNPRRWRELPGLVRRLRAGQYELGIDLQRIQKSAWITLASGAPRRLGFDKARCKEFSWLTTNERIAPNPRPGVTVDQYLEFADHLGLPPAPVEWRLPHPTPAAAGEGVALDGEGPRIVLNVGASKEANRWYPEQWAELCRLLVREDGARVQLTGGPEDRSIADAILGLAEVPLDDRVGRTSLVETAGLIAAADLFVGCDTGPLHLAVALGLPTVSLFGAADPERTGPWGQMQGVVRNPTPCSPCRKRHCHVAGHPCMRGLAARAVLERIRDRLLASAHNPSGH
jgi:lipopolysaccharide heptosyltransferase I